MTVNPLRRLLSKRYKPPFRQALPGAGVPLQETPRQKLAADFMMLKRWVWLNLSGQSRLLSESLPPAPARLLWIRNPTRASIGDSVMELAGRTLLGGYEVDLLTAHPPAELYHTDPYFKNIFTDAGDVNASYYDFILLDLFNTNSIRLKLRVCPMTPFATIQGFFYGLPYHHMLYSCYRINQLLGYPYSDHGLRPFLSPSLFLENQPLLPKAHLRMCMVMGGVYATRTYRIWPEVCRILRRIWPEEKLFPEIVLIGSSNGLDEVETVLDVLGRDQASSFVGTLSLRDTAGLISDCDFFVGPDGGLMHCAVALNIPGVALFRKIQPHLFLPPETTMRVLYDSEDVNDIKPELVARAIQEQLERLRPPHRLPGVTRQEMAACH
jgi:heptosyltransferase-2